MTWPRPTNLSFTGKPSHLHKHSHTVGVAGFEPTTSSSRTKRATKLRHTPCEPEQDT